MKFPANSAARRPKARRRRRFATGGRQGRRRHRRRGRHRLGSVPPSVAAGARVVCADIDLDAVRSLAASLGDAAIAVRCDVSRAEDAEAASRAAQEAFGSLTGLVNNAAAFVRDATVETIAIDDWRRTIDVNITGAMLMSRFAVPRMRQAGGGSIIHMASQLGHVGKAAVPGIARPRQG